MSRDLPRSAACVIVGGGAVGCSLAYHLTQRGLSPLLLERDQLGAGSTGRCAGGIRQQFSTAVNVRVGMLSRELLARFPEEIGTTAAYRPIGYLFLATTAAEAVQFERNVAVQRSVGLSDVSLITAEEAAALAPGLRVDDVTAATFCPSDGLAGPHEVIQGYANAARRGGAAIVEGAGVQSIRRDGDRVAGVVCGGQAVATPMIVNCAGPYAAVVAELAGVTLPVVPSRRHVFVTDPLPQSVGLPMTVDLHSGFYVHPEGGGLLLGMSDRDEPSSFDTSVSWDALERLVPVAAHRLPAIGEVGIATGWAGLYEITPDHQAVVGPISERPGFWVAGGFSGHGFMQAPAIGSLLADLLTGGSPTIDIGPFSPQRFGTGSTVPELSVF